MSKFGPSSCLRSCAQLAEFELPQFIGERLCGRKCSVGFGLESGFIERRRLPEEGDHLLAAQLRNAGRCRTPDARPKQFAGETARSR